MSKFFKTKWRVVTDNYKGYEVQKKFWWFPFWLQVSHINGDVGYNSFLYLDSAVHYMRECASKQAFKPMVVAKHEQ